MNKFEPLIGKIIKPTNQKIGKILGGKSPLHESTVRSWKKNKLDIYEEKLLEYRLMKSSFITKEDFNKLTNCIISCL